MLGSASAGRGHKLFGCVVASCPMDHPTIAFQMQVPVFEHWFEVLAKCLGSRAPCCCHAPCGPRPGPACAKPERQASSEVACRGLILHSLVLVVVGSPPPSYPCRAPRATSRAMRGAVFRPWAGCGLWCTGCLEAVVDGGWQILGAGAGNVEDASRCAGPACASSADAGVGGIGVGANSESVEMVDELAAHSFGRVVKRVVRMAVGARVLWIPCVRVRGPSCMCACGGLFALVVCIQGVGCSTAHLTSHWVL